MPSEMGMVGRPAVPAHEDQNPSLSISEGDDGRALLKCHAGCATEDVVAAWNSAMADLMPVATRNERAPQAAPRDRGGSSRPTTTGTSTASCSSRSSGWSRRTFRQRVPKAGGGWSWSVKDVRRVLISAPRVGRPRTQTESSASRRAKRMSTASSPWDWSPLAIPVVPASGRRSTPSSCETAPW